MKKLILKEELITEAELKVPKELLDEILSLTRRAHAILTDPARSFTDPQGRLIVGDFSGLEPLFPGRRVSIPRIPKIKLDSLAYSNNKSITNGLVLFYAMNGLAQTPADAIKERDAIAKFWNPETKSFSEDIINKAKDFEYPILLSLQATDDISVTGYAIEFDPNQGGQFYPKINICMIALAGKTTETKELQILPYHEIFDEIVLTAEHEIRHIIQFINEKCVRYGNEIKIFKEDFSKIELIPRTYSSFPPSKTLKTKIDPATFKVIVDKSSYNPDYAEKGKEKHARIGAGVAQPQGVVPEFFGLGKGKLDLKNPNSSLLDELGWDRKKSFDRYLKTDLEYLTWLGDLLTNFMRAIDEELNTNEKLLKIIQDGRYNQAAVYAINDYENFGRIMDLVKKDKEYLVSFYIVAKIFRKKAFYGDLVNELTERIKKRYSSIYPVQQSRLATKLASRKQKITEKRKKKLKEISKYRKMVKNFSNWLDK